MPTTHVLLAFVVASVALVAVPGPSVLFTISRSLAWGRAAGLLTVLGNALGLLVVGVALGLGALVAESALVFHLVKLAGAAYLVYLGVQAWRHRHDVADVVTADPRGPLRMVRDGFGVGVGNPKSAIFLAAVLPPFADPSAGHLPLQLLLLGVVFIAVALLGDSLWALLAGAARDWFGRSPRRLARLRAAGGVSMVGLGGALAISGRPS